MFIDRLPEHVRRRLRAALVPVRALTLAALCHSVLLAQPVSDEYRLKAAFLSRFPQFVDWPHGALEGRATIDLCLIGAHPFGRVLEDLVRGEQLAGRPLAVRQVNASAASGCQLLYLPDELTTRRTVLQGLQGAPVLTVSDSPKFLDEGGIVQLRLVDSRVRFEIDAAAAQRAGLRLSAQLLRLAIRVRGNPS